jgi:endonuclease/exonuclease/phosphatase family metal-dependent hydrolase
MQKKQLKLMTFNTYSSPGMYDRSNRINKLIEFLKTNTTDVDIVCLQELNIFRTGLISMTLLFLFGWLFKYMPHLCTAWDCIALLEGVFLKYMYLKSCFVYKCGTDKIANVAKTIGFNHVIIPPVPSSWVNTGTVILSKYDVSDIEFIQLSSDMVCAPGITKCTIEIEQKKINIINCHLQAPCDYNSFKYNFNRHINKYIFNKDIPRIINENIETLVKQIKTNTVVLIDANIDVRSNNYTKLIEQTGLINTADNPMKPTTYDNIVPNADVIDYVLSNIGGKSFVMDQITFSDHYPLICTIDLEY